MYLIQEPNPNIYLSPEPNPNMYLILEPNLIYIWVRIRIRICIWFWNRIRICIWFRNRIQICIWFWNRIRYIFESGSESEYVFDSGTESEYVSDSGTEPFRRTVILPCLGTKPACWLLSWILVNYIILYVREVSPIDKTSSITIYMLCKIKIFGHIIFPIFGRIFMIFCMNDNQLDFMKVFKKTFFC